MNKDNNILFNISLAVIVLLLFATVMLYMSKESEKDKRINLQKQFDELIVKEHNSEVKLKEIELANAEMSASIKFQEEKIDMLSKSFEEEKAAHGKNVAKIQAKEIETQNLKAKVDEVRAEKEVVLKNIEKLNEDYLNLKFNLESLIKTKEELEIKAKELSEREGISLGTVIVKQARN